MDEFIKEVSDFLISCGLPGLFISSLLAGSILPFNSEIILLATIKLGLDPIQCITVATLGNTAGGMTCYYAGHLGKISWIEKYLRVKKTRIDKMQSFLENKGAPMAFFAFLPTIGGIIAVTLGLMRSNLMITTISMTLGKLIRYIILVWILQETINVIF